MENLYYPLTPIPLTYKESESEVNGPMLRKISN